MLNVFIKAPNAPLGRYLALCAGISSDMAVRMHPSNSCDKGEEKKNKKLENAGFYLPTLG